MLYGTFKLCCTGHSENHQLFDINTSYQNSCLSSINIENDLPNKSLMLYICEMCCTCAIFYINISENC